MVLLLLKGTSYNGTYSWDGNKEAWNQILHSAVKCFVDLYQIYFVLTLPIASKTEWSQVASSLNIELRKNWVQLQGNASQNLLVTKRMKGKPHQENLSRLAMLSLLTTDEYYKDDMMLLPTTSCKTGFLSESVWTRRGHYSFNLARLQYMIENGFSPHFVGKKWKKIQRKGKIQRDYFW